MGGLRWTPGERTTLARLRAAGRTHKECAPELPGRSWQACMNCGFGTTGRSARTQARRAAVARHHAAGLSPPRMVALLERADLGAHVSTLYADHAALGLVPHAVPQSERGHRAMAACRRETGETIGRLRYVDERLDSYAAGWPACCAAAARHLDLWFRLGPATVPEHAARAGRSVIQCRQVATAYRRAGWLVRVGWHRRFPVLDLAPAVRERRRQMLALADRQQVLFGGVA